MANGTKIQTSRATSNRIMGRGSYGLSTEAGGVNPNALPMPQGISINTATGFGQAQMIAGNTMMNLGNTIGKIGIAIDQQNEVNEKAALIAQGNTLEQLTKQLSTIKDKTARATFIKDVYDPAVNNYGKGARDSLIPIVNATKQSIASQRQVVETGFLQSETTSKSMVNVAQLGDALPNAVDLPDFYRRKTDYESAVMHIENSPLYSAEMKFRLRNTYNSVVDSAIKGLSKNRIMRHLSNSELQDFSTFRENFINRKKYYDKNNPELSALEDLLASNLTDAEQGKLLQDAFNQKVMDVSAQNTQHDNNVKQWERANSGFIRKTFVEPMRQGLRKLSTLSQKRIFVENELGKIATSNTYTDVEKSIYTSELNRLMNSHLAIARDSLGQNKTLVTGVFMGLDPNDQYNGQPFARAFATAPNREELNKVTEAFTSALGEKGISREMALGLIPHTRIEADRLVYKKSQVDEMLAAARTRVPKFSLTEKDTFVSNEKQKILGWVNDPNMTPGQWTEKYKDYINGKIGAPPPPPEEKPVAKVFVTPDGTVTRVPDTKSPETRKGISPGDLTGDDKKEELQPDRKENERLSDAYNKINAVVREDKESTDPKKNIAANVLEKMGGGNPASLIPMGYSDLVNQGAKSINKLDIPDSQKIEIGKKVVNYWKGLKTEHEGPAIKALTKDITQYSHPGDVRPLSSEELKKLSPAKDKKTEEKAISDKSFWDEVIESISSFFGVSEAEGAENILKRIKDDSSDKRVAIKPLVEPGTVFDAQQAFDFQVKQDVDDVEDIGTASKRVAVKEELQQFQMGIDRSESRQQLLSGNTVIPFTPKIRDIAINRGEDVRSGSVMLENKKFKFISDPVRIGRDKAWQDTHPLSIFSNNPFAITIQGNDHYRWQGLVTRSIGNEDYLLVSSDGQDAVPYFETMKLGARAGAVNFLSQLSKPEAKQATENGEIRWNALHMIQVGTDKDPDEMFGDDEKINLAKLPDKDYQNTVADKLTRFVIHESGKKMKISEKKKKEMMEEIKEGIILGFSERAEKIRSLSKFKGIPKKKKRVATKGKN